MNRRSFLAGGACGMLLTPGLSRASSTPPGAALRFRVLRNGREIGSHVVTFSGADGAITAHIQAELRVGFGPITFFRYTHEAVETWRDGSFSDLTTHTNNNGKRLSVEAHRTPDGVSVGGGSAGAITLPESTIPFTHWNFAVTSAPLLDPQDGVAAAEKVAERGACAALLANGASVPARRYDFSGRAEISNWYDQDGKWTLLEGRAPDGSKLTYQLL